MKLDKNAHDKIISLWNDFVKSGKRRVIDIKGEISKYSDFDNRRIVAIKDIKAFIDDFSNGKQDLKTFKSTLDGYNKKNNYWGFTATKGQMFFNQLLKTSDNVDSLSKLIMNCIAEPTDLKDAQAKIESLENYARKLFDNADDKRKAPNPASCPYYLSYFWQVHDYKKWPIFYTSLIEALVELNIWKEFPRQAERYTYFYELINEIKDFLATSIKEDLSHWDVEHCFWWNRRKSEHNETKTNIENNKSHLITVTSFKFMDYIPPIVANLIEAGRLKGEDTVIKGRSYEQLVASTFRMLDFDVEELGQGKGREPDAVVKYRSENVAFIVDAKVRPEGYSIGTDDRAIKEYINGHISKLKKEGYKKTSFIIVSTSFNGDPQKFIDSITLETEIKRVTLLTSEALLSLLAYKLKENIGMSDIIEAILKNGIVTAGDIVESFQDI